MVVADACIYLQIVGSGASSCHMGHVPSRVPRKEAQ